MHRFVVGGPSFVPGCVKFMAIQLLYTILVIVPTLYMYSSYWFSGFFVLLVYTWSAWNGSSYYFSVFAKRYEKEHQAKLVAAEEKLRLSLLRAKERQE